MRDRPALFFFVALILALPAFPEGQTVLQQLGATTNGKGDVQIPYGKNLDDVLSVKNIGKELFEKLSSRDSGTQVLSEDSEAAIPMANHNCRPDLAPTPDPLSPKPAYLKEGLSSEDVFRLLGPPAQNTFCLACPLWKYREGFVVFTRDRTVAFWEGKEFEKYLPPSTKKTGPVRVAMTKDEVLSILGNPDGGLYLHNDWRYGKSHVIFSKNTGLVTHLLRFDHSL